jgi:signal transduction histidine kinase
MKSRPFFSNLFFTFVEGLIPNHLKSDTYTYRKAKVLTYVHLSLVLLGGILLFIQKNVLQDDPVPLWIPVISGMMLIVVFKKMGNLTIAGNLIAAALALPVTLFVPETGGLHSDNLLWLIIAPLIALLFGDRKSGIGWLILLLVFTTYLWQYDAEFQPKKLNSSVGNADYYFISYFFLFAAIFFIVMIFESGQLLIIKMLQEQKEVLKNQSAQISIKNHELQNIENRLNESLKELENFAYAASHDLKEPLRMIGMYTQLLKKRIGGQLEGSNAEFMGYVTDGVGRMQLLLDDLLKYSRLGKEEQDVRHVDLNNTLFVVVHNLTAAMKETDAAIVVTALPTVLASSVEMTQLFQNLISNAVKFRRKEVPPVIEIRVTELSPTKYRFMIADNGIGIPEQHCDRVFNIFERLNSRTDYEGSGIGLATCKKIVQNAGGEIWLESTEGVGTTFYFTLPKTNLN